MKKASERKIETSILTEKLEKKKRLEEEGQDNKAKFVTKAYEQQINLNKKMEMKQQFEEKYDKKYSVNEETGLMGFYSNLFTRNKDFGAGTRGEGEEKLVEEHKKRKDLYTKLIEDGFDKAVENNKKLEQEKEKKKQE